MEYFSTEGILTYAFARPNPERRRNDGFGRVMPALAGSLPLLISFLLLPSPPVILTHILARRLGLAIARPNPFSVGQYLLAFTACNPTYGCSARLTRPVVVTAKPIKRKDRRGPLHGDRCGLRICLPRQCCLQHQISGGRL